MGLLLGLISLAIRLASLALVIYCVLSFVAPGNEIYRKASMYIEPILIPIRQKLQEAQKELEGPVYKIARKVSRWFVKF